MSVPTNSVSGPASKGPLPTARGKLTTTQALKLRSEAAQALAEALRGLGGKERVQALREARKAGVGATELARLTGLSRARVYQLING